MNRLHVDVLGIAQEYDRRPRARNNRVSDSSSLLRDLLFQRRELVVDFLLDANPLCFALLGEPLVLGSSLLHATIGSTKTFAHLVFFSLLLFRRLGWVLP